MAQQMTSTRFDCTEKSIKEIIDFCKDLEGLEAEHNDLSVIGIPSQMLTKRNKKVAQTSAERPKKRKIFTPCPIHLERNPLHSMEDVRH